ncbi:hypothetical protein B0T11DRAFT_55897 [Plectosphaerella cucumerina]|uniref:Uncharacterized protein n=1 Tax=Plectosphaerella cucumerina TaxID=40658 RepID=A0A8K0TL86_9PEZI|nr:hypothetical protein B0T11DRAFT_55897 [Plectosphaerella cucumerina]
MPLMALFLPSFSRIVLHIPLGRRLSLAKEQSRMPLNPSAWQGPKACDVTGAAAAALLTSSPVGYAEIHPPPQG